MVIGPNHKFVEIELLLLTTLNKKLSLNQPIDSLPIILKVTNQTYTNKYLYHSKTLKDLGIISIPLIPLPSILLLLMSIFKVLNQPMKLDLKTRNIMMLLILSTSLLVLPLVTVLMVFILD